MSAAFQRTRLGHSVRKISHLCQQLSSSPSQIPQKLQRIVSTSTTVNPPASGGRIIFSGIQPTGVPHLGNYLGALQQWVRLQNEALHSTKLIFSIVDLHALTVPQDPSILGQCRKQMLAALIAVGIDPKRSTIFFQSAVSAHSELMWILSTISSMGYLSRMTQWKSKLQLPKDSTLENSTARSRLKLGLFSYPVLQAADILVHRATDVPVGEDQKQHLEFTREVANGFNHIYGPVLTMPSALISPAKRVMSLKQPTLKMSKSHSDPRSRILLTDSSEEIHLKIKLALTDSHQEISYDPINRPGVSNLIEILSHVQGRDGISSFEELGAEYQSFTMRAFKEHVAVVVVDHLNGIRQRYLELMNNKLSYLDTVAEEGAKSATENADTTLRTVKNALGLF
ncbi:tryptophanyl-tRNA synthetase [Paracoccidioides lutzii Pb01]|uniref:Tryptophan--tRNA ligase, mitochondrial n=1 Tax=Paracoccidioides lutzii (strain ATCC MYA-826 / Pb01) TaxID=502779 RepID=C1GNL2_PARBA|nr:tryptophanyl-tRNA synthetase [Paracoccidioides lutzii Pb01]EEH35784.2 tryptophanyl-tRNA synthetase [Paracoccidioides lutzii Pb01]